MSKLPEKVYEAIARESVRYLPQEAAHRLMVTVTTSAMTERLAQKKASWNSMEEAVRRVSKDDLKEMLHSQVEKGDMIDLMNIAGIIYLREQIYGPQ